MSSFWLVSRLSFALIMLCIAYVASESPAVGQGNDWTPSRETNRSASQIARRVQQKQIRLPPPVRLAQFKSVELKSIDSDLVEDANTFPVESTETYRNEHRQAGTPMLGPETMGTEPMGSEPMGPGLMVPGPLEAETYSGFSADYPPHLVIRSPEVQAKSANRGFNVLSHGGSVIEADVHGSPNYGSAHHGSGNPGHDHKLKKLLKSGEEPIPPPPIYGQNSRLSKQRLLPGPIQARHATIPGGRERAVWKQPYSYGYFGASGSRHWGTHHGYRDRYTEYRYK